MLVLLCVLGAAACSKTSAGTDEDRSESGGTTVQTEAGDHETTPTTESDLQPQPGNDTTTAVESEPEPRYPNNVGTGVTVAILDRGIDYDHPDFLNPDGTTRIKGILDMTGQNWCVGSRDVVEYTEADINQALATGIELAHRDAVGHGTATTGSAAGNGSALEGTPFRAPASGADILMVKLSSEGALSNLGGPAEDPFNGCLTDALVWLDDKIIELDQPAVALWNVGAQWGPIDGTSIASREIEAVFGADRPGRVWVVSAGDEGSLPNHAGGSYGPESTLEIPFDKEDGAVSYPSAWLSGHAPAQLSIVFDNGITIGPLSPGSSAEQDGVTVIYYPAGAEAYPWTSTSGDNAIWMTFAESSPTSGFFRFENASATGFVDLYGDVQGSGFLTTSIEFTARLVPGRLTDLAAIPGAVVVGVHVEREVFDSEDGSYSMAAEGSVGDLWHKSSDGPTRDGRDVLDVTAPGHNYPAALSQNSGWDIPGNTLANSNGMYVRFGATSGAGPIVVGAVALMLEVNPTLTGAQVKEILRSTATADAFTGEVPNDQWGYGKLNIVAAVEAAAALGQ